MSLTTSMNNALSGLAAASRGAQVVSSNVANATTEGYGVRELRLSARANTGAGQGVVIDGVVRIVDDGLISERWLSSASSGEGERLLEGARDVVDILGDPSASGSLSQSVALFDSALSFAISRPDDANRLTEVLRQADGLASTLNRMTAEAQSLRETADANIAASVERLNTGLANVAELNGLILRGSARGDDVPALLDQRQRQIDAIAELVPIRMVERANGAVALYTPSGTSLLDVTPSVFEFAPQATITSDMTLASGALSGLRLDGRDLVSPGDMRAISGGRLAAEFTIRDQIAPTLQRRLDNLAAELVVRYSDAGMDNTITPGDPGLFADGASAFDPLTLDGLAGRINVNAAVDPAQGGALWRIRDGIGATVEGPPGDATRLIALKDRLGERLAPAIPVPGQGPTGVPALVDGLLSTTATELVSREDTAAFRAARFETLDDALRADGVNTDQEMQKLLLIERFYAANAKIIEAVDEMLGILTRL